MIQFAFAFVRFDFTLYLLILPHRITKIFEKRFIHCLIFSQAIKSISLLRNRMHTLTGIFNHGNTFLNTEEFAVSVHGSDNYFVLITRENLYNLPYSVEEIYGLHTSGKHHDTRKVYQQIYQIYPHTGGIPIKPERIITEDSNAGYEFFKAVSEERGILCGNAAGKSNLFAALDGIGTEEVCIVADGAAIGSEMNRLYHQAMKNKNIHFYLPESFEWIILNSGLVDGKELRDILEKPEDYIDSREFLSWERYFAKLLTDMTEGTYFKYKKTKLNGAYLHEKNKEIILKSIKGIRFLICS